MNAYLSHKLNQSRADCCTRQYTNSEPLTVQGDRLTYGLAMHDVKRVCHNSTLALCRVNASVEAYESNAYGAL